MSKTVLLVEDDAAIATVIRAALEDEGFTVERTDSIAGRDRLLGQGTYAVMLTDVVLADGDGIGSLRRNLVGVAGSETDDGKAAAHVLAPGRADQPATSTMAK